MGKKVTVIRMNGDYFGVVEGELTLEQRSKWCVAYDCSDVSRKGRKKSNLMSFQVVVLWENGTNPDVVDPLEEVDRSTIGVNNE